MSKYIKVFNADSPEYARLQAAAELMTKRSPLGYHYHVGDTYFDFGQNWVWTTILCDGGYQALYPRDQERIITGDIDAAVTAVFADKYCPDHIDKARIERRNKADVAGLVEVYGLF